RAVVPVPSLKPHAATSPPVAGGGALAEKVAVAEAAAAMVSVQEADPVQAPPQLLNAEPAAGVAVKVTTVAAAKEALQLEPQLIPAGDEVTVPLPVPAFVMPTMKLPGIRSKFAVT